jgi:pyruvate formate lyase activating enzyme
VRRASANASRWAFSDAFYAKVALGRLEPVLDTLRYLRHETTVWLEITTLLIPGLNDGPAEIDRLTRWVNDELSPDVPVHFSAFHPSFRMLDVPPTPPSTLTAARRIALDNGLHHVYTGNVRDRDGGKTVCAACGTAVIDRDGYRIIAYRLDDTGHCASCGCVLPGLYAGPVGTWGPRRLPVHLREVIP